MNRKMFSKLSSFLQQAVDTFAPNLTAQEEFVYHWKCVTNFFVDHKDGRQKIEETAIAGHVDRMLEIIQQEENGSGETGTTGPCLEYLLQHRLMDTLYTLGRTDQPPGMKQVVLCFFTRLLSRMRHPLLPHVNVHRAVQRLIKACGEVKAAPTEREEIEFLCTVCAKIKTDPYLVNFFLETPAKRRDDKKIGTTVVMPPKPSTAEHLRFGLVDALISLAQSEDAWVAVKACEGLMLCASLPEPTAAACLVERTLFCTFLADRLVTLYDSLPLNVSPALIDSVDTKWGFDSVGEREEDLSFPGRRRVAALISWLDYVDRVVEAANPAVALALAQQVVQQLLTSRLEPAMLQTSESGIIIATSYFTKFLRTVCSGALLKEFCIFLLGSDRIPEILEQIEPKLRYRLLERCNHLSEEVCLVTLRLFDTLLQKEEEHIFHNLVLRNLLGRDYYLPPAAAEGQILYSTGLLMDSQRDLHCHSSSDDQTDKLSNIKDSEDKGDKPVRDGYSKEQSTDGTVRVEEHLSSTCEATSLLAEDKDVTKSTESQKITCPKGVDELSGRSRGSAVIPTPTPANKSSGIPARSLGSLTLTDALVHGISSSPSRPEVHKVVNSFLSLLPEEAKSSYHTGDSSYDMYLRDAHKQFSSLEEMCKGWNWPSRAQAVQGFQQAEGFYPGSFLKMLFTKIEGMLEQSHTVNLLVTGLAARLALMPHPVLHEFLLDPFVRVQPGVHTLFITLTKVCSEIRLYMAQESEFTQKLTLARKQLLGITYNIQKFEDQGQMEAIIVLEEFCKELSAIAFVKHHAAVTKL